MVRRKRLGNNSRVVVVDCPGAYRLLYVGGRPNWEYKFRNAPWRKTIKSNWSAIRVAKREPKFDFRGRTGESSNPLFRGFDLKTEETERYDQRCWCASIRAQLELRRVSKTAEELYAYHAVVLDDLESAFSPTTR